MSSKRTFRNFREFFGRVPTKNTPAPSVVARTPPGAATTANAPAPPQNTAPSAVGDALETVRSLGVALSKIAIYGSVHPASTHAIKDALAACRHLLSLQGETEIAVNQQTLYVNGTRMSESDAQRLAQHMERQRLPGFVLTSPLIERDFSVFLGLLGTPLQQLESKGGMAGAMAKANLQSVKQTSAQTLQTTGSASPTAAQPKDSPPPSHEPAAKTKSQILEWPTDMTLEEVVQSLSTEAGDEGDLPSRAPSPAPSPTENETVRQLDMLLQQLQTLTRSLGTHADKDPGTRKALVGQLRQGVSQTVSETRSRIARIASAVQADRPIVAALQEEARDRGITLRYARNELLTELAEVVQELHQPLTVATGVVDMLRGGTKDAMTPNQAEMLKLASESMAMVGQLAGHLKTLVGDPEELTPNAEIRRAAYGQQHQGPG